MIALILAVALSLARTQSGAVRQLPKDTLIVDGQRTVGVAIPEDVVFTPGDLNFDGRVSTADIVALVQRVFANKPLPSNGDTIGIQLVKVTTYADTTRVPDSAWVTFIPWNGVR